MSSPNIAAPARIRRLELPEHSPLAGMSLRAGERQLEANAARLGPLVDLTYADTVRFPPPGWAIESFTAAATRGGLTYTPYRGDAGVRARVAGNVARFLGMPVAAEGELILTPGSQAALYVALASLVERGDKVALVDPDYLTSHRMLRYFGAEVVSIPLWWENAESATLDLDALESAFRSGVRLFLFSNPNNPTGTVHGPDTVARIAALALQHGAFVVADELYSRLVYDGRPFCHIASLDGMKERTVTLLGPSKTESMSGYRLGAAVAPAPILQRMEDVQSVAALRAPAYAQHTLVHWLADDRELVAERIGQYQALRDTAVRRFQRSEVLRVVPSGGTSYLFPKVVGVAASDQEIALRLQNDAGVIINPGYQSGARGTGHFRICFAQEEQLFARKLDDIVGVLERMHAESRLARRA
ncbi:pyridoxal phosphate-dependent aminotransferase [Pigmentiphaga soli]|uniref:Pyridoxal phosphate-dependent aminotransferase n=1 Tax=Pigmentiphaga soli TaxID=1007095 RepID=A0ABP8GFF7_9BURK